MTHYERIYSIKESMTNELATLTDKFIERVCRQAEAENGLKAKDKTIRIYNGSTFGQPYTDYEWTMPDAVYGQGNYGIRKVRVTANPAKNFQFGEKINLWELRVDVLAQILDNITEFINE